MFSKSVVKYIQSLQQKKFRELYNSFVAEGPKVINELLEERIFLCKNIYATEDWKPALNVEDLPVTRIKDHELEKLAAYSNPNQVIAEFECVFHHLPARFTGLNLILDDIRDPGNFGTIIRTADWFGVEYLVCSEKTVDMYNPKVVQGTMASLGRVKVIYTEIEKFIEESNVPSIAAVLQGKDVRQFKPPFEGFLIIGNESSGVKTSIADKVEKISIPGYGKAESLNAAIAAGILLYALR